MCPYVCVHVCICVCMCAYVCACVHMCVCMCVCARVYCDHMFYRYVSRVLVKTPYSSVAGKGKGGDRARAELVARVGLELGLGQG